MAKAMGVIFDTKVEIPTHFAMMFQMALDWPGAEFFTQRKRSGHALARSCLSRVPTWLQKVTVKLTLETS